MDPSLNWTYYTVQFSFGSGLRPSHFASTPADGASSVDPAAEPASPGDAVVTSARNARSQRKRGAILEGARGEFLRHGYAAASMDRIAAAAAVSKATVYSHFNDKEALFRALTEQMVGNRLSGLFGSSPQQALPAEPTAALRELANRCLASRHTHPEFLSFLRLVIGESERFPELAKTFVSQLERTGVGQVVQLFAASPTASTTSQSDLRARIFMGALVHLILMQDLLHGSDVAPIDRDQFADLLVRLVSASVSGEATTETTAEVDWVSKEC